MLGRIALGVVACTMFAAGAGDAIRAGEYQGEWTGAYGSGNLSLTLAHAKDGYRADMTLTVDPEDMDCEVESLKVDGAHIEIVIEYGNRSQSEMTLTGTLKGKTIEGRFKTTQPGMEAVDDEGTWSMIRL